MTNIKQEMIYICGEMVYRQYELLPLLSGHLNIPVNELFYYWKTTKIKQSGGIPDTNWKYFFHGYECDLKNLEDGRLLLFHFGPHGTLEVVTRYALLQFILTSKFPWNEYPDMKSYLKEEEGILLEDNARLLDKVNLLYNNLKEMNWLERADAELYKLDEGYKSVLPNGNTLVMWPEDTPLHTLLDSGLAHRFIISELGWQILKEEYKLMRPTLN